MSAQVPAFQKRSDISDFQMKNSHAFSTVLDTPSQLKRKKTPQYRRIDKYYKSTQQYWKERNRRKMAYELYAQGLTQQQIAEKLGVCSKTVATDLRRTRAYHKGQLVKMLRTIQAERDAEYLDTYNHLSLRDQVKRLEADAKLYVKLFRTRQKLNETMTLTVRLDEFLNRITGKASYGRPYVDLRPDTFMMPLHRFRLRVRFLMQNQQIAQALYSVGKWGPSHKQ